IPDSQKVRAWVRKVGITTFFGGMLARPYGHVQAMATAWASNAAPVVNCLKPFLLPDMWYESNKTQEDNNPADDVLNGDEAKKGGEQWFYDPKSGDKYVPYDPSAYADPTKPQTGYGSAFRLKTTGLTQD